jgi:hypothetical protein
MKMVSITRDHSVSGEVLQGLARHNLLTHVTTLASIRVMGTCHRYVSLRASLSIMLLSRQIALPRLVLPVEQCRIDDVAPCVHLDHMMLYHNDSNCNPPLVVNCALLYYLRRRE